MTPEEQAYAIAEQRIAEAKARGARYLSLSPDGGSAGGEAYTVESKLSCLAHIPPALADLTGLIRLDLDGSQVKALAPLAGLFGLQWLDLKETPVADISHLAGLTELQRLYLTDTQVADIAPLAELTALQWLRLTGTRVANISPLVGLAALQILYLSRTQVEDISPLSGLNDLQTLALDETRVANISPLASLTALQWLWLNSTQVEDLSPLKNLRGLEEGARENGGLFYTNCPNITDPVLRVLSNSDGLERTVGTLAYLRGERADAAKRDPLNASILHAALSDVQVVDGRVEAVPFAGDADLDSALDVGLRRLKSAALAHAVERLAGAQGDNAIGKRIATSLRLYAANVQAKILNPGILEFEAGPVQAVLDDPFQSEALGAFDKEQLGEFLRQHRELMLELAPNRDARRAAADHVVPVKDASAENTLETMMLVAERSEELRDQEAFGPLLAQLTQEIARHSNSTHHDMKYSGEAGIREAAEKRFWRIALENGMLLGRIMIKTGPAVGGVATVGGALGLLEKIDSAKAKSIYDALRGAYEFLRGVFRELPSLPW